MPIVVESQSKDSLSKIQHIHERIKKELHALATTSPRMILIAALAVAIFSSEEAKNIRENPALIFAFFILITDTLVNIPLKLLLHKLGSKSSMIAKFMERPNQCGVKIGTECGGCSPYPGFIANSSLTSSGMPSGHAQTMGLTMGFISTYLYRRMNAQKNPNRKKKFQRQLWWQCAILFFLTAMVCFQRVLVQCHSIMQVSLGYLLGFGIGIIGAKYVVKI